MFSVFKCMYQISSYIPKEKEKNMSNIEFWLSTLWMAKKFQFSGWI